MAEPTPERILGYWRENIRRSLQDWEGREPMIGLLVFVLIALGYGVVTSDPAVTRFGAVCALGYVALLMLVVTPWQMWRDSQATIIQYRERLRPRLSFVFEPDVPPYLARFVLKVPGRLDRIVRLYRVGIRNDSAEIIRRVRVVIESIAYIKDGNAVPPSPDQPALIEHALNVMAIDKKTGTVSLSPGDRPTAYIDVVEQFTPEGAQPEQWMSLCYATGHRTPMHARGRWILGLRAEGGGTYCRARFVIDGSEMAKDIVMSPYGLG
jgi:hypothetical protein